MPVDSQGLTPLGTLIKPAPDFFSDYLFSVGAEAQNTISGSGEMWYAVHFYNGDLSGRVARIWAVTVNDTGGNGFACLAASGVAGNLLNQARQVRLDGTMVNCWLYEEHQQTALGVLTNPYNTTYAPIRGVLGQSGFDSTTNFSPFPLFIVPANWSLIFTNSDSAEYIAPAVWFTLSAK